MKKYTNSTNLRLTLLTLAALTITSCNNKAADRKAELNPAVASNIMAIKDAKEVTAADVMSVYVSSPLQESVEKLDPSIKQIVLAGKMDALIKKVTIEKNKKIITEQLKAGSIAIVVLKDQIKIMKVVPDLELTGKYDVLTLQYFKLLKKLSTATEAAVQSSIQSDISKLKDTTPLQLKEKFGLVEVTAIKIEKYGVIDNERTDYDEKKSVLNLTVKPMSEATHMLLGTEIGAKPASEGEEAAE